MTRPHLARTGPPVPPGIRELRTLAPRTIELRAKAGGAASTLDGYASVTEEPYTVSDWLGEYSEVIAAGAFRKTLDEQDDVRLLLNHDGQPIARTKSGTLQLDEDDTGLHTLAELDRSSHFVNDIAIALERGDLDQMSFAFQVTRQTWSPDYEERRITEVKLFDVSVVTYPANPATSAALRSQSPVDVLEQMSTDDVAALIARAQRRLGTTPAGDAVDPVLAHLRAAAAAAL